MNLYRRVIQVIALCLMAGFTFVASLSCNGGQDESFGIYLADTGEPVLTELDISAYHASDNTFELNREGIEKWNSYIATDDIPKLDKSLFSREFIIKIEGREICQGIFWSSVSSQSRSEIVILDALFILDETRNTITIQAHYPGWGTPLDEAVSSSLTEYFEKRGLLK